MKIIGKWCGLWFLDIACWAQHRPLVELYGFSHVDSSGVVVCMVGLAALHR